MTRRRGQNRGMSVFSVFFRYLSNVIYRRNFIEFFFKKMKLRISKKKSNSC